MMVVEERNSILYKLIHDAKANPAIKVTDLGIITDNNPLLQNAPELILKTEYGIEISFNE